MKPTFGDGNTEHFIRSVCSINKLDCDTVVLQINEHNFLMSYNTFVRHLEAMLSNANDFNEQYRQHPRLRH